MQTARAVGADGGEEVPVVETDERVLHLSSVSGEEDGAATWTIAYAENITFLQG